MEKIKGVTGEHLRTPPMEKIGVLIELFCNIALNPAEIEVLNELVSKISKS
jgi:hypothetical protein